MSIIHALERLHDSIFQTVEKLAGDWFIPLAARMVFSSVLMVFFLNSALTKVGEGFPDFLIPGAGAYGQIIPPIAEAASYDVSQIAFFPWKIIVLAGTYTEFILPILLFLGLFTRLTSFAFIGFIIVMSFVDIQFHGLEAESIGMFFDRLHNGVILDQRLFWVFPLIYLVIKGGGTVSLDHAVMQRFSGQAR